MISSSEINTSLTQAQPTMDLETVIQYFKPYMRQAHQNYEDDNFLFNSFNQFSPATKYEFIYNLLFLADSIEFAFGFFGLSVLSSFLDKKELISEFDEQQRYTLAQMDISRAGIRKLDLYQLTETQKVAITEEARAKIRAFLPPRISDESISECLKTHDLESMRQHIFNRFGDKAAVYNIVIGYSLNLLGLDLIATLTKIQHLDTLTDDLRDNIQTAMQIQEAYFLECGWYRNPRPVSEHPPTWGTGSNRVQPEDMIDFSHGGGFFYILKFLKGETQGYRLEREGTGLQVSPQTLKHERDSFYAEKAYRYFDYPARFSGRIQAKYLDSSNNGYEAGLRPEFIEFLVDITITRFDTGATYTIRNIQELAALEAFFRAQPISVARNPVMNRRSIASLRTSTIFSHPDNTFMQPIVVSHKPRSENMQAAVSVPLIPRSTLYPPTLSRDNSSESLYSVSLSTSGTDVSSDVMLHRPIPRVPMPSSAAQGRHDSFYLLWMAAVIFAIVSIIALCWALNVLLAPTLGMGPMAIAVAAALFIKTTPFYLSLIYTATSVATSLIANSLFKTRERPVEVDPQSAIARTDWEQTQQALRRIPI